MGKLKTLAVIIVFATGFSASAYAQGSGTTTAPAVAPIASTAKVSPKTWNKISGNWKQYKGKIKEKWGKLTKNDLAVARGSREALVGTIQKRYGLSKAEADKQVADWLVAFPD